MGSILGQSNNPCRTCGGQSVNGEVYLEGCQFPLTIIILLMNYTYLSSPLRCAVGQICECFFTTKSLSIGFTFHLTLKIILTCRTVTKTHELLQRTLSNNISCTLKGSLNHLSKGTDLQ